MFSLVTKNLHSLRYGGSRYASLNLISVGSLRYVSLTNVTLHDEGICDIMKMPLVERLDICNVKCEHLNILSQHLKLNLRCGLIFPVKFKNNCLVPLPMMQYLLANVKAPMERMSELRDSLTWLAPRYFAFAPTSVFQSEMQRNKKTWKGKREEGRKNLESEYCEERGSLSKAHRYLSFWDMAAKKMEVRMNLVEERVAEMRGEVQREMESVRSESQCLVLLEKSVKTLFSRMMVLDRMERWLQKVEESDLRGSSSGVKAAPSGQANLDRGKGVVPETADSPTPVILGVATTVGFEPMTTVGTMGKDSGADRGSAVWVWVHDTTRPMWGRVTLAQAHNLPLLMG
ncbi:hypothetical protein TIFTF001_022938 [Ficus carica]|uniref:Uncharacterized protein n=1 Tax=Ficus carica TaxID=3494 RepID=A0AA88AZR9_FICCA|nr:hypothetical protein TIFTF001_022938 [Ficus carica]